MNIPGGVRAGIVLVALLVAPRCSSSGAGASNSASPPAGSNPDQTTVPHGDHNPRHGGVVLMHGDLHYEVLIKPSGNYQVYFSDALRAPLPATIASMVTITITRKTGRAEIVTLQIANDGESWIGDGMSVEDPEATARIAYEIDGKGYWIDVPFAMHAQS